MAHAILGNRFVQQSERGAPWHDIVGAIVKPDTNVTGALAKVDGALLFTKAPLFTEAYGDIIEIPNQFALVRPPLGDDPQIRVAGIVGTDYEIIQHADFARMLDPLVDQSGWCLETLGLLHGGAQLFVTFHAGGMVANEDLIDIYWVMNQYHAKSSVDVFSANTRVVCANTYRIAENGSIQRIRIPHFQGAAQELDFALQMIAFAEAHKAEFKEQLEAMGRTTLLERQVNEILEKVYLDPPQPRAIRLVNEILTGVDPREVVKVLEDKHPQLLQKYVDAEAKFRDSKVKIEETREAVYERYDVFNQSHSHYARTAWGLWNAVTEVENHKNGKARGVSTLFGSRADVMQRAYSVLLESVN